MKGIHRSFDNEVPGCRVSVGGKEVPAIVVSAEPSYLLFVSRESDQAKESYL